MKAWIALLLTIAIAACRQSDNKAGVSEGHGKKGPDTEQPFEKVGQALIKDQEAQAGEAADSTTLHTPLTVASKAEQQVIVQQKSDELVKHPPIVTTSQRETTVNSEGQVEKRTKASVGVGTPTAIASKPKRAAALGKFAFDEDVYDFGEITEGDIVEYVFTFTNTGKKAINIEDCNVTCGCTYPSYPFLPIAPGDKGDIKVRYNSVGKIGPQEAKVTVNSDATRGVYVLTLKGQVYAKETGVESVSDSTQQKK